MPAPTTSSRRSSTNTLDGGYSQGGILVYGADNDYVKINAISDDGQGRVNRLELRSEVGGGRELERRGSADHRRAGGRPDLAAADQGRQHPTPASTRRPRPARGRRSPAPVTNAMVAPRFGLYTQGVLQSGDTVDVRVLLGQRRLDRLPADRAREQRAGHHRRDGDADRRLRAADRAVRRHGDRRGRRRADLRWDFDGDGDTDSTVEDPSHTYTAAGTYEAEVTVSDGEDERTRTVTVTVFGADDPEARFRVLVFSQDDGLPPRLDRRRASPRSGSSVRRTTSRSTPPKTRRSSMTPRSAHYDAWSCSSRPRATRSTTPSRPRSSATSARAAATPASTRRPTPSTTWTWYGKLVGAYFRNHPAGTPERDGARRGPRPPLHRLGLPARWPRADEWYNYQQPEGAVVGGGGTDWSPREAGVHVLATVDESHLRRGRRQHDG